MNKDRESQPISDIRIFSKSDGREIFSDPYLSPKKAAKYLDVSKRFIYELIARREVEVQPLGRRLKRIRQSTLEKWLLSQKGRKP